MIYGIYQTASGLDSLAKMQEIVANNLANITTNGFKQELVEVMKMEPGKLDVTGRIDMSSGAIKMTENPANLTIAGDGMFAIKTDEGMAFTRNGDFKVDQTGRLVTTDGYPVLGKQGEIVIGENQFTINRQGEVFVKGELIDQLELYNPQEGLQRVGHSLMKVDNDEQLLPMDNSQIQIIQGAVEASNVNPVENMVDMMMIVRQYEANQKAMHTLDDAVRQAVNQVGKQS